MRLFFIFLLCFITHGLCTPVMILKTDMQAINPVSDDYVKVDQAPPKKVEDLIEEITLSVNHSGIYESHQPIKDVFIVNDKIVEIKTINPNSFYILGLSSGETELYLTMHGGADNKRLTVRVISPIQRIRDEIARSMPGAAIKITPLEKGIILEGSIYSAKDAQKIEEVARFYLAPDDVLINNITVSQSIQVGLQVKIAEVTRGSLEKLNIDWSGTIKGSIAKKSINLNMNTTSSATNSLGYANGPFNILAALDMLAEEKKASILAEPTLITLSGKTANFLAGGEIPYQSSSGSSTSQTSQSIEFKPYGIKLSFTPTVIGDNIHLTLNTEVSNPDDSLSVENNGTKVPALSKKQAETHIVLKDGQTLMIAGMLYSQHSSINQKFPGFGDIPLLGFLFSSNSFEYQERELVIVVTPHIVSASEDFQPRKLPTDYVRYVPVYGTLFSQKIESPAKFEPGFLY